VLRRLSNPGLQTLTCLFKIQAQAREVVEGALQEMQQDKARVQQSLEEAHERLQSLQREDELKGRIEELEKALEEAQETQRALEEAIQEAQGEMRGAVERERRLSAMSEPDEDVGLTPPFKV
jgi:septal ring factor EnvC (AmiA/AmiB activator)